MQWKFKCGSLPRLIIVNKIIFWLAYYTLTLAIQLFRIIWRLGTLVDDKPPLHYFDWNCHNTLSPMFHCNRPPVCQRNLLFGMSCLPVSGLHLKGLSIIIAEFVTWLYMNYDIWLIGVYQCFYTHYSYSSILTCSSSSTDQGHIFKMGAIFNSDSVSRAINESALSSWATKLVQPCPSAWWSLEETIGGNDHVNTIALAI